MSDTKILVVEDEHLLAMSLEKVLQSMGYKTSGYVTSGEEAVSSVMNNPPDLILMDIKLNGGMNGIETVEEIHRFMDIPVIYVTAYSDDDIFSRAILTHPFGYLIKPYKIREIQTTIETAINRYNDFNAERAFRIAEKEKSIILNSVSEEICHIDTDYTIKWMNKKGIETAGLPEERIIGEKCHSLWFDSDTPCEGCSCTSTIVDGIENKGHVRRPDGRVYEVVSNPVMEESDGISGAVLTYREITKEIEAQKREDLALKRIEDNLERMSMLNDHIRNPLSVIVAIADMQEGKDAGEIIEQAKIIDNIILKLDEGWLTSAKIREYLRRNHGFENPE